MKTDLKKIDNVLVDISSKTHHTYSQAGDSQLVAGPLKKRVSALEMQLMGKKYSYRFSFEWKNRNFEIKFNNKEGLPSKIEIQKVSNTGIGNEYINKLKKKLVVTGDSMLNGISEKGLIKSHKVTVENFSGGTSNITVKNVD